MSDPTTTQRLVQWAAAEEEVRAVLLVGSRGEIGGRPDRLSDHDVLLFVRDRSRYEASEGWLTDFGTVLVKLHAGYEVLGTRVATRLVQYREGHRIDFSIHDLGLLDRIAHEPGLPDLLNAGFRVLIDKDGRVSKLPEPTGETRRDLLPDEASYRRTVNEFWWEVLYVAKHLARGELLPALYSQECVIRFQCLVPMLEWHARTVHGSESRLGPHGRGLLRELDATEVERLARTHLGSSVADGWEGLFETIEYFRELSSDVAEYLGLPSQDELARDVTSLVRDMRASRPEPPQTADPEPLDARDHGLLP